MAGGSWRVGCAARCASGRSGGSPSGWGCGCGVWFGGGSMWAGCGFPAGIGVAAARPVDCVVCCRDERTVVSRQGDRRVHSAAGVRGGGRERRCDGRERGRCVVPGVAGAVRVPPGGACDRVGDAFVPCRASWRAPGGASDPRFQRRWPHPARKSRVIVVRSRGICRIVGRDSRRLALSGAGGCAMGRAFGRMWVAEGAHG